MSQVHASTDTAAGKDDTRGGSSALPDAFDVRAYCVCALENDPDALRWGPSDRAFLVRCASLHPDALGPRARAHALQLLECEAGVPVPGGSPAARGEIRSLFVKDGRLALAFTYDHDLYAAVRALPERRYDRAAAAWLLPTNRATADALRVLLSGRRFHISAQARELCRELSAGTDPPTIPLRLTTSSSGLVLIIKTPISHHDWTQVSEALAIPAVHQSASAGNAQGDRWAIRTEVPGAQQRLVEFVARHDVHVDDDIPWPPFSEPASHGLRTELTGVDDQAQSAGGLARLEWRRNRFALHVPYTTAIVDDIRRIPGRRFLTASRVWTFPAAAAADLTTLLERHSISATVEANGRLEQHAKSRRQPTAPARSDGRSRPRQQLQWQLSDATTTGSRSTRPAR